MTTEQENKEVDAGINEKLVQENKWREEFEKWNNYPLRDGVYQRIDIWLAACQSMQAEVDLFKKLYELEKEVSNKIGIVADSRGERIEQLESKAEQLEERLREVLELLKEFDSFFDHLEQDKRSEGNE